jgi:hypothetical protein
VLIRFNNSVTAVYPSVLPTKVGDGDDGSGCDNGGDNSNNGVQNLPLWHLRGGSCNVGGGGEDCGGVTQ